jgi:2-polyprenyl-3-methyl-5-hydroxy-6-metoxy-1,4-benzoquinol methylase
METAAKRSGLLTPYLQSRRIAVARPFLTGRVLDVGCNVGALTELVPDDRYVGVDIDEEILTDARRQHPDHRFMHVDEIDPAERFDTVVSLAVIEHVSDPEGWLNRWSSHVTTRGRIVLTTPHARWEPLHGFASKLRLTSIEAHDDHESVLDRRALERLIDVVGLELVTYRRFLGGMNQLVVAERP